jgi:hypothetical protein
MIVSKLLLVVRCVRGRVFDRNPDFMKEEEDEEEGGPKEFCVCKFRVSAKNLDFQNKTESFTRTTTRARALYAQTQRREENAKRKNEKGPRAERRSHLSR